MDEPSFNKHWPSINNDNVCGVPILFNIDIIPTGSIIERIETNKKDAAIDQL